MRDWWIVILCCVGLVVLMTCPLWVGSSGPAPLTPQQRTLTAQIHRERAETVRLQHLEDQTWATERRFDQVILCDIP